MHSSPMQPWPVRYNASRGLTQHDLLANSSITCCCAKTLVPETISCRKIISSSSSAAVSRFLFRILLFSLSPSRIPNLQVLLSSCWKDGSCMHQDSEEVL